MVMQYRIHTKELMYIYIIKVLWQSICVCYNITRDLFLGGYMIHTKFIKVLYVVFSIWYYTSLC